MYGSTVRVRGLGSGHHLHSHEVRYPRGSGYQSVTGMGYNNDYNSLWTIK
jgi:dolichyl-phosphate-mannose--protein O-mannosyl transferase